MPRLAEIRRRQLLSQQALAQAAGVSESTVFLTEAGRTVPRLSVMARLCAALGVAPEQVDEFRRALGIDGATD